MSDGFFQNCVLQALEPGYNQFDLTPCTGDIFMDDRRRVSVEGRAARA